MRRQTVLHDARGGVLMFSCILIVAFFILGATLHMVVLSDTSASERQREQMQALAIADAGLERAITDLRHDLQDDFTLAGWSDGDINGIACPADTEQYRAIPYAQTTLGEGSYAVEYRNVENEDDEIWLRTTSRVRSSVQAVQAYVKGESMCCWDNAIFAGSNATGLLINGNVQIAGSVHILGNDLDPTDLAMDMGGGAAIVNNHSGLPAVLKAKIGPIPSMTFNGESVESLRTVLRVRRGRVGLSGSASAGSADVAGNSAKETLDGVYVTDGFAGNKGSDNVHADNGFEHPYDLTDEVEFPEITAPFESEPTYLEYLRKRALVIDDATRLAVLAGLKPTSTFCYVDAMGKGSIGCDGNGNLTISGIVYIAGDLAFESTNKAEDFTYTGRGSLVATGTVTVEANLYAAGAAAFPGTNIIAIMTPGDIKFTGSQRDAMGLFYAQGTITSTKQTDVVGSFVSNYFDMGQQVPAIFYVPVPRNCFPPGLIGTQPVVSMKMVFWQRIAPPN